MCPVFRFHLWLDEGDGGAPYRRRFLRNAVVVATGSWVLVKIDPDFWRFRRG
jgi:NAD(P)H-quinone oxidoreductase subunit 5